MGLDVGEDAGLEGREEGRRVEERDDEGAFADWGVGVGVDVGGGLERGDVVGGPFLGEEWVACRHCRSARAN